MIRSTQHYYRTRGRLALLFLILLGLIIAFLTSCGQHSQESTANKYLNVVVTIENCEYFTYESHGVRLYIHKGNCRSSIHQLTSDTIYLLPLTYHRSGTLILRSEVNQ